MSTKTKDKVETVSKFQVRYENKAQSRVQPTFEKYNQHDAKKYAVIYAKQMKQTVKPQEDKPKEDSKPVVTESPIAAQSEGNP